MRWRWAMDQLSPSQVWVLDHCQGWNSYFLIGLFSVFQLWIFASLLLKFQLYNQCTGITRCSRTGLAGYLVQPSPTDKVPRQECARVSLNETSIEKTQADIFIQSITFLSLQRPLRFEKKLSWRLERQRLWIWYPFHNTSYKSTSVLHVFLCAPGWWFFFFFNSIFCLISIFDHV